MTSKTTIDALLNYWPLIIATIGGSLTLIGTIFEMRTEKKHWRSFSHVLLAIGGVITIVSAGAIAYDQSAQEAESKKKDAELLSISKALINRTNELVEQGKNINKLTETIAEKNYQISQQNKSLAKLAQKSLSTITGGDSYCYFLFFSPSQKLNSVDLMLINEGRYPLYDVFIKIDDVEKQIGIVKSESGKDNLPYDSITKVNQLLSQASKSIQVGNMGPKQAINLGTLNLPETDKQSFNINIMARNGHVIQFMRFRRVNKHWKAAMKVIRNEDTLQETIEQGFPRDNKGRVEW